MSERISNRTIWAIVLIVSLGWASLLYLGVIGTFVPVVLYYWLIQNVTVAYSAIIGYITPFIGVVMAWLVLDEEIGWGILAGGGLILAGVVVADLIRVRQAHREADVVGRSVLGERFDLAGLGGYTLGWWQDLVRSEARCGSSSDPLCTRWR